MNGSNGNPGSGSASYPMNLRFKMAMGIIIAAILCLAGCGAFGEAHNYNAPPPYKNYVLHWVRLESPGNYHTIIFACHNADGIYLDQSDNNSVTVTANDPNCRA
jgi:hypothetical protein